MFDDIKKNIQNSGQAEQAADKRSSSPVKDKVEDIYAETEQAEAQLEKPAVFQPKEEVLGEISENNATSPEPAAAGSRVKKVLVLSGIIVGLAVISIGGFLGYNWLVSRQSGQTIISEDQNFSPPENEQEPSSTSPAPPETSPAQESPAPTAPVVSPPSSPQSQDSDQDSLTDEEERILGTDINNVDSDQDGLFDREEVKVYQTDPLNPDTDGDGFLDGQEVKAGYDPKGAGRLYEIGN